MSTSHPECGMNLSTKFNGNPTNVQENALKIARKSEGIAVIKVHHLGTMNEILMALHSIVVEIFQ